MHKFSKAVSGASRNTRPSLIEAYEEPSMLRVVLSKLGKEQSVLSPVVIGHKETEQENRERRRCRIGRIVFKDKH